MQLLKRLNNLKYKLSNLENNILPILLKKISTPKIVFHVLTPEHKNMGDHAITLAVQNLLKNNNIKYKEITINWLRKLYSLKRLNIFNGNVILINGGGNLGTLWLEIEIMIREIIIANPNSSICILPNTIYYDESEHDKIELQKSKEIYNNHSKLLLYAREEISYDLMKKNYLNVTLIPDMVLSLNKSFPKEERSGCMLCFRNDCERTLSPNNKDIIINHVHKIFDNNIIYRDMQYDHTFSIAKREHELEKMFQLFRKSEIVVTDRLHGMIFSVITSTPCIVLNCKSPKIYGCYKSWLKDIPYIYFLDNIQKFDEICLKLKKINFLYDSSKYNIYFNKLIKDIKSLI